jgi:hypothetical protein
VDLHLGDRPARDDELHAGLPADDRDVRDRGPVHDQRDARGIVFDASGADEMRAIVGGLEHHNVGCVRNDGKRDFSIERGREGIP